MSPNLNAFLAVIRHCEGTSGPDGYRTMVGGGLFDSFADHPRVVKTGRFSNGKKWRSTAAGAYQFLSRTWDEAKKALDLPDFSPESQDRAAVWLIERRGALQAVEAGDLRRALSLCAKEWASLPGSPYGQPTHTYEECERVFIAAGGEVNEIPPSS
jgi:lysozyme